MIDHKKERIRLQRHIREAVEAGNTATLTLGQWLAIIKHFNYRCAYCIQRAGDKAPMFQLLEHVTPVNQGGGTTHLNCVPACISCNKRKDGTSRVYPIPDHEIAYVRSQLAELHSRMDKIESKLDQIIDLLSQQSAS